MRRGVAVFYLLSQFRHHLWLYFILISALFRINQTLYSSACTRVPNCPKVIILSDHLMFFFTPPLLFPVVSCLYLSSLLCEGFALQWRDAPLLLFPKILHLAESSIFFKLF